MKGKDAGSIPKCFRCGNRSVVSGFEDGSINANFGFVCLTCKMFYIFPPPLRTRHWNMAKKAYDMSALQDERIQKVMDYIKASSHT